ncbi:MAG: hypothetical protein K2X91_13050 [Thermoleophilia bacterium]|nr:hypothetical protein [Thermoleophilia bacterium]
MTNDERRGLWAAVRRDFESARTMLPRRPSEREGSVSRLDEWLDHNELELALDELESLGEDNAVAPQYWQALAAAADRMGLSDRRARLISRCGGPGHAGT